MTDLGLSARSERNGQGHHAEKAFDSLSVVVPCFNEESNVLELASRAVEALERLESSFEIVFVDDGSSDETWSRILEAAKQFPGRIRPLRHESNLGMFAAWRTGLSEASGDLACLIDADLQNPPEAIPQLYRAFRTGQCHILQGTRSSIEWMRDARYRASRGLNLLLNLVFRDAAQDNKSGFVIAPTPLLQEVLAFESQYQYPQTFIRVSARSRGYSVGELETLFQPRRAGVSFLDSRPLAKTYLAVIKDIWRARREFGRGQRHPVEAFAGVGGAASPRSGRPNYSGVRRLQFETYFWTMPLHAWLIRSKARDIYLELDATQWMSTSELEDLQMVRLQRLLWHAYVHVPYYRRIFERYSLHPTDFRTLADIRHLPLISKAQVAENLYFDLFSDVHRKRDMLKISTSGSTGSPFTTYADRQQLEVRFANTLRSAEWTGWRFGDPQVRLWHQTLGMSPTQVFKERLDAFMLRRTFIPAFEMTESGLASLVAKLNRVKPTLIDGYAESLNFLASYLGAGGSLEFRPRAVMSSAQMLTAQTRQQIERGLGCRVYDKYGAREFSGIAYQCQHGTDHHVMDESYIVEVLRDGNPVAPGELGEVVITDLNNFSVPLIRYRIGDLALGVDGTKACACGRGLSRIGDIQGRTQALVHCANGRWLPGTFFAHFFKEYEYAVRYFQVQQHERGAFTLLIVKAGQWSPQSWDLIMYELREFTGATSIDVEFVDAIPLLQTGKRTPVISTVNFDFQNSTLHPR